MKTGVVNKDIIAHFVRLIMQCIDEWDYRIILVYGAER
ncbi:hypothetical protein CH64_3754 [Yersinia rohdei]|uniref:Uncharacterized protein n=1 Tax=Yersinia rohdei TaxID=29485 RepID=A0A0U1HUU6_YERRO|nr:hypothetical protein CH64_3754 [Yersinia rohdei]EEQ01898.1 hypothetical protein yrohd0001_120 [Yersinia rohdei ATCC 43380]CNF08140.1 Uncharacterised protein [Yersinia rohdei]CNJ31526.1 Uncharacterised protein [Yersinia rohdei]CQI92640.1 Uncharacterised protein [Yersinia rohdei]